MSQVNSIKSNSNQNPIKPLFNEVDWSEGFPLSKEFDDIFCQRDVIEETNHVFLVPNNLVKRWKTKKNYEFNIGELGFGIGLNFFITLQAWINNLDSNVVKRLNFISFDKFAPKLDDIKKVKEVYPQLSEVIDLFLENAPAIFGGVNKFEIKTLNASLTLVIDDVQTGLKKLSNNPNQIDAWYFDGFDPRKNQDMWNNNVFKMVGILSNKDTTFGTYTASGFVKRNLIKNGFTIKKSKGFGNKRHMLCGEYSKDDKTKFISKKIAIIGSGLSASILANKLASKNCVVDVFEKGNVLAAGTSSNPFASMYPKFALGDDARSFFIIQSYFYAFNYYKRNVDSFNNTGILFLSNSEHRKEWLQRLLKIGRDDIFERINKEDINSTNEIQQYNDGVFCRFGGALSPKELCLQAMSHKNINVRLNSSFEDYKTESKKVFIKINNVYLDDEYDDLIICTGSSLDKYLPQINSMRGGIVGLKSKNLTNINYPINHSGYFLPVKDGINWIGSSYEKGNTRLNDGELEDLIINKSKSIISFIEDEKKQIWSGIRSTTPDRLPIAGNLDNSNVYVIGGLASRGLSFAPLLADYIGSKILNLFLPISKDVEKAIQPNRFIG
jgi:tRNA 5-methylaminomethyl-2-thiouridine biosynthesis bifunctional protein